MYNPKEIEQKWQEYWESQKIYKVENNSSKPKYYVLDMFPYPSGAGLHVGHPLGYIASDIVSRYKRMKGFNVLHPMGFDSFGLPAEQYAIDTGVHPAIKTKENITRYISQLKRMGFSYDWEREVRTSDPEYYKWTQWIFLQIFNAWYDKAEDKAKPISTLIEIFEKQGNEAVNAASDDQNIFSANEWNAYTEEEKYKILLKYRLAYLADTYVNWCPALGTVLANDEVINGVSERGGHPVEQKLMRQWSLRISAYAQRLLDGLEKIDWSDSIKEIQKNWIGRSEGALIKFEVIKSPPSPPEGEELSSRFPSENKKNPPPTGGLGGDSTSPNHYSSTGFGYHTTEYSNWQKLKPKALENRKNPTKAEELIWERVRKKQLGFRIRRQHPIAKYIVDFVCLEKKLVIEIDGKYHDKQQEADAFRTKVINDYGFRVIRFSNQEVFKDIENVILKIQGELEKGQVESPPSPPEGEELSSRFPSENKNNPPPSGGLRGDFIQVFTTRPDTIFGATFMVLAPEHELVQKITSLEFKDKVENYIQETNKRSERDRLSDVKNVSGQFTGAFVQHPFLDKKLPIYIADYVLAGYGTGAIMAVPSGDQRDYDFAKKFDLEIIPVSNNQQIENEADPTKEGKYLHGFIKDLNFRKAFKTVIYELEKAGIGTKKVNFRLRDAIFSRQRYWGEPFPIYYKNGMPYAMDEKELPLELPQVDKYLPTQTGEPPLARAENFTTKEGFPIETNTMPGWAGSSWYFFRYMDAENKNNFADEKSIDYWKSVDFYLGGAEHATGHLLYARFWTKFLFDLDFIPKEEPFDKLINQGMILGDSRLVYRIKNSNKFVSSGLKDDYETTPIHVDVSFVNGLELDTEAFKKWRSDYKNAEFILEDGKYICGSQVEKMSKRYFNVVNPDDICEQYGADALRLYEMFLGPLEDSKPWDTKGIEGVSRFLKKVWRLFYDNDNNCLVTDEKADKKELKVLHTAIQKIENDIKDISFNTAVSAYMICVNELLNLKCNKKEILKDFVLILAPFAPHLAEELWQDALGNSNSVVEQNYPKFNADFLVEDEYEYPISINGKVKRKVPFPLGIDKNDLEAMILEHETIKKLLDGKEVRKLIVVRGRIVNFVV